MRLELYLYAHSTAPGILHDQEECQQAHCPQLARIYANHGVRFGMATLGAKTTAEVEGRLKDIMRIWDNRKTKAATEATSVQEAMHMVFAAIRTCVNGKVAENARTKSSKQFGKAIEQMCTITITLGGGTEVEEYPRLCHQASIITTNIEQVPTPDMRGRHQ
jgi:hypothetical protein